MRPLRSTSRILIIALALTAIISIGIVSSAGAASGAAEDSKYQLSEMKLFNWVILNIKDNYLDQKRINPSEMLSSTLNYIERMLPEVLITELPEKGQVVVQVADKTETFSTSDISTIWEMSFRLKDIFNFIQMNMTSDTDPRDVEYMAINGMLSTLDPHSVFLKPELFKEIKTATKGRFGGLGIQIQAKDGYITVIAPLKNTPAWKAGIQRQDKIVRIEDESTANMSVDEAVNRLRGIPGTKVALWIMREGLPEAKKVVITREEIVISTIESQLLDNGVGYIKLSQFTENSASDLVKHYNDMKKKYGHELKGLILDMRDNPGGLMDSSIKISNTFLKSGTIVSTVAQEGTKVEERKASSSDYLIGIPVAILINGGSASASEIVAGALKDNNRAVVIGQKSFGKGSVQVLFERQIPQDKSSDEKLQAGLKLTVAQYLTPSGTSIQSVGITPDIFLQPLKVQKDKYKLFYRDRQHKEKDLAKHLDDDKAQDEKSSLVIGYVSDEKNSPDLEEEEVEIGEPLPVKPRDENEQFFEDFPIRYAKRLIQDTGAPARNAMIMAAKNSYESISKEEESSMTTLLTKEGLDWSPGPPPSSPAIKSSLHLEDKEGKVLSRQTLHAGEESYLVLNVRNAGKEDIFRLAAVIDSKEPLVDGKEFLLGRLPPGSEKTSRIRIKTPRDYLTSVSEYQTSFFTDHTLLGKPIDGKIHVTELARPRFIASYKITESPGKSNKNDILEPGETFSLSITSKNIGKAAAPKPKISIKNLSGRDLFIKNGRCDLKPLPKGKSDSCSLPMEIRRDTDNGKLSIILTVYDAELGEPLSEKIQLDGRNINSIKNTLEAPDLKVSAVPNNVIVESPSVTIDGMVTDQGGIKDFFIKVNDKKIFYKAADGKSSSLPFKVTVPLKNGINSLYLVARKTDELMSIEKFILTRSASPEIKPLN